MTLYVKAAEDGTSVGDCPFGQSVRIVLHEKGLDYELRPSVEDTKPSWLVEHYDGKMPALRHRKECYVESEVICQYIDYFFPDPVNLSCKNKKKAAAANEAVDGFFPAVAKYLKHTPDGDEEDDALKANLEIAVQTLEDHLSTIEEGDFLCGDQFTLQDCALAPKLYHMATGVKEFKSGSINFAEQFPVVTKYMEAVMARPSVVESMYPEDVIVWGWGNARN
jgi:glutathione S-transferase